MTVPDSDLQRRYTGDRSKFGLARPGEQSGPIRSRPPKADGGIRCGLCLKGAGQVLAMFEAPTAFIWRWADLP